MSQITIGSFDRYTDVFVLGVDEDVWDSIGKIDSKHKNWKDVVLNKKNNIVLHLCRGEVVTIKHIGKVK